MTRVHHTIRSAFLAPRSRSFFKRAASKRNRSMAYLEPETKLIGLHVARDLGLVERSWQIDMSVAALTGVWDCDIYETDCDNLTP